MDDILGFLNPMAAEFKLQTIGQVNTAEPKGEKKDGRSIAIERWNQIENDLAEHESGNNPKAVGKSKDVGLFQITPIAIAELNRKRNLEKGVTDKKSKNYVQYYRHEDMYDPEKNKAAAMQMWIDNYDDFVKGVGRPPTIDEQIMMHNRPRYWDDSVDPSNRVIAEAYLGRFKAGQEKRRGGPKPFTLTPLTGSPPAKNESKSK